MTEREALKLALEALEDLGMKHFESTGEVLYKETFTAIKEVLAQPEQEPKCGAIIEVFGKDWRLEYLSLPVGKHKLYTQQYTYTTPPQRTWVGLTDEEQQAAYDAWQQKDDGWGSFYDLIEAKLKEKNSA